ncbi:MAG: aminoglycoside phosphotransferase family protein [Gammaproteobacteria bacterium]
MKENILVRLPSDLTIDWARRIVSHHFRGAEVFSLKIDSVDIGTTTRVRLTVDHSAADRLPRRWFVKLPSMHRRARAITALPRLLHTEVRFYKEVAESIPVNCPAVLAGFSKLGRGTTLVLTDITESGANPGHPEDTLNADQALMVVKQLARLHTHFWNKAHIYPDFRWLSGPIRRMEDGLGTALAVPLMQAGLRKAGSAIPKSLHAPALRYARRRRRAMRYLSSGPKTLIHHDCHPGNIFWKDSKPGFLDWQLVRIGEGISDIAYFLATALEPETRLRHEAGFLAVYHQTLVDNGIPDIDFGDLMKRYCAHLVYPFEAMIATLAVGGLMDSKSNLSLIRRTAAAIDDLDAFSALPI